MNYIHKVKLIGTALPALIVLAGCGSSTNSVQPSAVPQAALVAVVSPSTIVATQTATLSSTGGSGTGAVSFAVASGSCTISGTTLTAPAAAGTCTVTGTKAADSTYSAITSAPVSVTVNQPTNTISFSAPSSPTVGGATVSLSGSASSSLPVTYASSTPAVCTVTAATLTPVTDGTCTIVASQAGNGTYPAATPVTVSFSINGEAQTITFASPTAPNVGNTASLAATASSGLTVGFAASPATVCTVSGTTLTAVTAGSCTVTASQNGDATFAAAASVADTIAIGSAAPAQLVYSSGFTAQASGTGLTLSGGQFGGYAGSNEDGYYCNTGTSNWCGGGSSDATPATSSVYFYYQPPAVATGEYVGVFVQAPGVTALNASGNTSGVQISGQTGITFTLNQNPEWFAQANHNVLVMLTLGNFYGGPCRVQLQMVFTPTSVAPTTYTLPLAGFSVAQNCGLGTLTPSAAILALGSSTGGPVAQVDFQGDSGASAITPSQGTLTSSANVTTANSVGYPTTIALTGPITFQ